MRLIIPGMSVIAGLLMISNTSAFADVHVHPHPATPSLHVKKVHPKRLHAPKLHIKTPHLHVRRPHIRKPHLNVR